MTYIDALVNQQNIIVAIRTGNIGLIGIYFSKDYPCEYIIQTHNCLREMNLNVMLTPQSYRQNTKFIIEAGSYRPLTMLQQTH